MKKHILFSLSELDGIKKILKDYEKRLSKLEKSLSKNSTVQVNEIDAINQLMDSSFFENPKKFKEIINQLRINAAYEKKGNYRNALSVFVRDKKLKRKQIEH